MNRTEALDYLKHLSTLHITVSGDIGSGKSTFAKHLAVELDVPRSYIGQLMREEAAKRDMTLDAFNALLESDDTIDRQMDELQKQKSQELQKGVFEGRTAWYFVDQPDARVFLTVDPRISAERVYKDQNALRDTYKSVEEVMEANAKRKENEIKRFSAYYNIDIYNKNNFDILVDTSHLSIEQAFDKTVIEIAEFLKNKRRNA